MGQSVDRLQIQYEIMRHVTSGVAKSLWMIVKYFNQ